MKQTLLALALIFSLLTLATAQSDLKDRTKSFRNSKRFAIQYDKFKDQTLVNVGPFGVSSSGGMFGVYARFLFKGSEVEIPVETFQLGIVSYSGEWQWLHTEKVYLLIDGERIALNAERSSQLGGSRAYIAQEWLMVAVDADTFQKLANGKSVQLKAGRLETKLKGEHLTAFRDLLSLARP